MRHGLVRALAAIDGALLLTILSLWILDGGDLQAPAAAAPEPVPPAVSIRVAVPQPEALLPMLERPLFAVDRRPAESARAAAPDGPDPAEAMSLVGLAGTEDGGTAIVTYDGGTWRLRLGEKAGAWTLEGIESRSARFRDEGRGVSLVLTLSRAAQPQPAAAAPLPAEAVRAAPPADPMATKSMEQRIAERRARREALEARRLR